MEDCVGGFVVHGVGSASLSKIKIYKSENEPKEVVKESFLPVIGGADGWNEYGTVSNAENVSIVPPLGVATTSEMTGSESIGPSMCWC